jgi:hypothetical protein
LELICETHATDRPVKLKVALAVDALAYLTDPPKAPAGEPSVHVPT